MYKTQESMKVAVRCKLCGRIVAYKLSQTSGRLQMKCPKCGTEIKVDLSLRRSKAPICYRSFQPNSYVS